MIQGSMLPSSTATNFALLALGALRKFTPCEVILRECVTYGKLNSKGFCAEHNIGTNTSNSNLILFFI